MIRDNRIDTTAGFAPPSDAQLFRLAISDALLCAGTLAVGLGFFIAICAFFLMVA